MAGVDLTDEIQAAAWEEGWDLAHEPARCGHARANWKDPKWRTPEYAGHERCEFCEAIAALRADLEAVAVALKNSLTAWYIPNVEEIDKALARPGVRKVLEKKDG